MRFKRPTTTDIDMGTNIINLVDVLLLLLIFFMISTTFTKQSALSIQLPEANTAPASDANERQIDILITADSHFSIGDRGLTKTDVDSIKAALQEVSGGDNTRPLSITADGNTPHQAVVRAMDAAGQLGFAHLSLTTQLPKEK